MPSGRTHIERWLGFASSDLTLAEIERLRPLCDAALDLELEEVRFRKIHDALWTRAGAPIVPPDRTRAAICLVRDPRDVAVSFAHHAGASHEWAVAALGDPETAMIPGRSSGGSGPAAPGDLERACLGMAGPRRLPGAARSLRGHSRQSAGGTEPACPLRRARPGAGAPACGRALGELRRLARPWVGWGMSPAASR